VVARIFDLLEQILFCNKAIRREGDVVVVLFRYMGNRFSSHMMIEHCYTNLN
jgi:hypothetical protein